MTNLSPTALSMVFNASVERCYRYFRNFEIYPDLLHNITGCHYLYDNVWEWILKGSEGTEQVWRLALETDIPNKLMVWKTVQSPDIEISTHINFQKLEPFKTLVSADITVETPNCPQKELLKSLHGISDKDLEKNLHTFQALIESQQSQQEVFTDPRGMPSSDR